MEKDHPDSWQVCGPSPLPYGGRYTHWVQEFSPLERHAIRRAYPDAARRALDARFK